MRGVVGVLELLVVYQMDIHRPVSAGHQDIRDAHFGVARLSALCR